ncbi:hypothetical protein FXW26_01875 [Candidatus Liberibacter asiaticus]|nr:hypothetical protein FXW26_01875 [Candidatus Liberibacter asiaticus]KAE9516658.1 hypothetical protein FXW27_01890 [Candidatus Liberibacter asiaticus]KAE9517715.1 hypothetical protein FXW24_01950 [Candidatus Liberibacter asiaticus]
MKEKGISLSSANCFSVLSQIIVFPSRRAGVPVLRRPVSKSNFIKLLKREFDGESPILPAGIFNFPICITPLKNVPVVKTTVEQRIILLSCITIEEIIFFSVLNPATSPWITSRFSWDKISLCIAKRYNSRSA